MPSPSRRLTTLWFADIAGFTRLSAQDEPLALQAMEAMQSCVKRSVSAHNGTVIKFLGDGALAEFPSTEGGVEAALELAASFKGATTAIAGGPFQLHIGIHVGDMGQRKGAADALDRLARAGDPDLICLGVDPEWTSTRDEAQFRRLASRALGSH